MITKMFIEDFIHVVADKIEWTLGNPKWIWHVRCDRCAKWPGRTARSQDMAVSMAKEHYTDYHTGIRDNGRQDENPSIGNEVGYAVNGSSSSSGRVEASRRKDRWAPYYVANRDAAIGKNESEPQATRKNGHRIDDLAGKELSQAQSNND